MTENEGGVQWPDQWLRETALDLQTRIRRHRILFVQSSPLHVDAAQALLECLDSVQIDATTFCELVDEQVEKLASGPRIVAVMSTEKLALPGASQHLGKLRASAYIANQRGLDLCIVSILPKSGYPDVPGSSILADSKSYYLPLLPVVNDDHSGASVFPIMRLDTGIHSIRSIFCSALVTLSIGTLVALDRAVFELSDKPAELYRDLNSVAIDELRGCGLISDGADGDSTFTVPRRFSEFKMAIGDAISGVVDPPSGYNDTVSSVFTIERTLRNRLRSVSQTTHGEAWRKLTFSGDFPTRILDRARQDAYPLVKSVSELRDPFEWLTLGELIELIRQPSFGYLGRSSAFWSRFAGEILPVRNRLSHMRLPTEDDARVVRTWELLLARAFSSSR